MRFSFIFLIFIVVSNIGSGQCYAPVNLSTNNIHYYNAELNWNTASSVFYYRIRYKELGTSSWSYINNIDSSSSSQLLVGLNPITDYIWQIKSYCDSTNTNTSNWSVNDTFTTVTSNCPNTSLMFTSSVNYNNAVANWALVPGANRYKIRYKNLGASVWSNLGPIYHPVDSTIIPLLQQNTTYEWQIITYHDTTTLLASLWSTSDTFTTGSFVASPFNPTINNNISSLQCNDKVDLYLNVAQSTNEPDIGTSIITSSGGYFDINSINSGDSIGYANLTTSFQSISATLRVGIILGQNNAIINSYDNSGSLIGFFTISNENGGIKVSSTTPNDGNNYTSGYTSELCISNLFVNPSSPGYLYFYSDVNSELYDQVYTSDSVQIWCYTSSDNNSIKTKKIVDRYDVLGKKNKANQIQIIKFSDGSVEKRLYITPK